MSRFLSTILFVVLFSGQSMAQSEGREFLTSCTYGVLAGALVGAATLAVEDNPDDKLHRIARGASLGLYTGILLGLYVAYWVPNQGASGASAAEVRQLEGLSEDGGSEEQEGYEDEEEGEDPLQEYEEEVEEAYPEELSKLMPPPRMIIYPIIENQKVTGAAINVSLFSF